MLHLPADIYPNPLQRVCGTPAVVFRDHRWTLPAIFAAMEAGLVKLPVTVVSFDRHRDALTPADPASLTGFRGKWNMDALVRIVRDRLSARDDDWIPAGMELGIISDVVQFGIDDLREDEIAGIYKDAAGEIHRVYRLARPGEELAWKGALSDPEQPAAKAGLWKTSGWDAHTRKVEPPDGYVLDFDLDAFTFSWERYTFPYTEEIWKGEYLRPVQSSAGEDFTAAEFVRELARGAQLLTIATEPGFCGGAGNAERILEKLDKHIFCGELDTEAIETDYKSAYPEE